jgi:hypothetical protein
MEFNNGNWRIKNPQNLPGGLATFLLSLTALGESIGVKICNLDSFTRYLVSNDFNEDYSYLIVG